MQFLLWVKFKIRCNFPLLLSTEPFQILLISSQGCAPGLLDELATVGRSCKGHCNILVPTRTVHFLFYLEAKKSHKALGLLQLGNLAAYHHSQQAYF